MHHKIIKKKVMNNKLKVKKEIKKNTNIFVLGTFILHNYRYESFPDKS